jgi:hypothetical protein
MNSQLKEVIVHHGQEVAMSYEPLKQYFAKLNSPPRFLTTCRGNERGYLGKWALLKEELYLTEFIGVLENGDEIALEFLFPGKSIVFAEWFNGEIILNQGKLLALKSKTSPAIYEKDLHLEFLSGRLTKTFIVENTPNTTEVQYADS